MEIDVREGANADEVLRAYFAQAGEPLRGRSAERLREAERQLRRCLEGRIEQLLSPAERTILHAEREFAPHGAGARLARPAVILQVLPVFLETWGGAELDQRLTQLNLAQRLLELSWTFPSGEEDLGPLRMAVKIALRRSRRHYQLARLEDRWRHRLNPAAGGSR